MRALSPLLCLTLLVGCVADKESGAPGDSGEAEGSPYVDADGDGVSADRDCDDADSSVFPGAADGCDGQDNDCDGEADEDAIGGTLVYADADGDGYGDAKSALLTCAAEEGYVGNAEDCDDADALVSPVGVERCDGADNDCDGAIDDDVVWSLWYADADADGFGSPDATLYACAAEEGYTDNHDDCDDGDAETNPSAEERCDAEDNDCDGTADEHPTDIITVYLDYDGDGYGNSDYADTFCDRPDGWVETAGDCDDRAPRRHPGAEERCDDADDDCDGEVDEDPVDGATWWLDGDGDGYGGEGGSVVACDLPTGYAEGADDCDDADSAVSPGAEELCDDEVDNDCDGGAGACSPSGEISASDADITLLGDSASDFFGRSGGAGDFNGDGAQDLVVGASNAASGSAYSAGSAWLVLGPVSGGSIGSRANLKLEGPSVSSFGYAGQAVALLDIDADGLDELIVGAYGVSASRGQVGVVPGDAGLVGDLAWSEVEATITGSTRYDYLGFSLAAGGDVDGDGLEDLLVGAYGEDSGGSGAGAAYLYLGVASGLSGALTTADADWTILGSVTGSSALALGCDLRGAGDVDGDGLGDMVVGASGFDGDGTDVGAAFLFYGSGDLSGSVSASDYDGILTGSANYDVMGARVSGAGDTDGDGYADLLFGARAADPSSRTDAGAAALVPGSATRAMGPLAPTARIYGEVDGDLLGDAVGHAGDINGDDLDEVLVGAYAEDTGASAAGAAYLFYGPLTGNMDAGGADLKLTGPAEGDGYLGRTLIGPLDADGDGVEDLFCAGYLVDTAATDAGAVYGLLGGGL